MKLKAFMFPLRVGKYYEQILISFENLSGELYPTSLTHVDTFWEGRDKKNDLHNRLAAGEALYTTIIIEIEENTDG